MRFARAIESRPLARLFILTAIVPLLAAGCEGRERRAISMQPAPAVKGNGGEANDPLTRPDIDSVPASTLPTQDPLDSAQNPLEPPVVDGATGLPNPTEPENTGNPPPIDPSRDSDPLSGEGGGLPPSGGGQSGGALPPNADNNSGGSSGLPPSGQPSGGGSVPVPPQPPSSGGTSTPPATGASDPAVSSGNDMLITTTVDGQTVSFRWDGRSFKGNEQWTIEPH